MKRYHVPRLAFINKMDRTGANYGRVVNQLREKLDAEAVLMQLPIGKEENFLGIIDLVTQKAYYSTARTARRCGLKIPPADMKDEVVKARQGMLEALSMYSDSSWS